MMLVMNSPERTALRADARRNRDAIVTAARAVFAEAGLDAPLDAIARRAGVGRATLYRRFATRDDLVAAIHEDNLDELERIAAHPRDRDRAFVEILTAAAGMLAADRGFVEHLRRQPVAPRIDQHVSDRFMAIIEHPLRRAQRAAIIREDLRPPDALLILDMIGGAAVATGPHRDAQRVDRALDLLLDGLRPGC
jgi:AcrR family transcriptional regulator